MKKYNKEIKIYKKDWDWLNKNKGDKTIEEFADEIITTYKIEHEPPKCETCGFCLVDSTQSSCSCGKYKW